MLAQAGRQERGTRGDAGLWEGGAGAGAEAAGEDGGHFFFLSLLILFCFLMGRFVNWFVGLINE